MIHGWFPLAPSVKTVEISLLAREPLTEGCRGSVTWIARGLQLEQTQIILRMDVKEVGHRCTERQLLSFARRRDRLSGDIATFLADAPSYLGPGYDSELEEGDSQSLDEDGWDGGLVDESAVGPFDKHHAETIHLPLPSVLGPQKCQEDGLDWLAKEEKQLRTGQANDALHELRLALADKAVLFCTDVRHASSQATTSRAWGRVMAVDATVNKFAKIYRASRRAMVALGASNSMLARYQVLSKDHLKVSSAVAEPNARGHRNDALPWFWSMDVARDAEANDWMMECKAFAPFLPPDADSPSLPSSLAAVQGFERSMGGGA